MSKDLKVYLLASGDYSDYSINMVVADRKLADRIVEHMNGDGHEDWRREDFALETEEDLKFFVTYRVIARVVRGKSLPETETTGTNPYIHEDAHVSETVNYQRPHYMSIFPEQRDPLTVVVQAVHRDEERAHRIARDHARAVLQRLNDGQTPDQITEWRRDEAERPSIDKEPPVR